MIDKKYLTHAREPFFEIARDLLTPHSKVLDIGAGNGSFSVFCERNDFFLLEGNAESVALLKERYPNAVEGKLPGLPFPDYFFDMIHMSHVIEHLQPPEVYDTLVEMDRCCKPGGAIVISAPLLWDGFYDDLSHIKPYPPTVLRKYLCDKGYSNLTRKSISRMYKVERLEYRFQEKGILFSINKENKIGVRMAYKILTLFRKMGFKQYTRTGYTIVLRKAEKDQGK